MIFVYIPVCHWVWGGGFLGKLGVVDFAGGIVVHVSAGFAALSTVLFFGPREKTLREIEPSNLPLVAVGAGLLWFGWFGFNAGGAYAGDGLAAYAFTNTTIAGSIAMTVWLILDWHYAKRPSFSGILVGAVAGLATITPCAGYVPPWAAILIGAIGSIVCYYAKGIQSHFKFDDALEVFRAHGMGGLTGALLVGIFASTAINTVSAGFEQFFVQLLGVVVVAAYSFVVTWIILKIISHFGPIRVSDMDSLEGLDEALHGERAYETMDLPGDITGEPAHANGEPAMPEAARKGGTAQDAPAPGKEDATPSRTEKSGKSARPDKPDASGQPEPAGN